MSELQEHLEYIADRCDPLEIIALSSGYGFIGDVNGVELSVTGKDIKEAAFEMMDAVRNQLHD